MKGKTDDDLWRFAAKNGYILVSKDSDFYQRSVLYGPPPKFVWLRIGNCSREQLVHLLNAHVQAIRELDSSLLDAMLIIS